MAISRPAPDVMALLICDQIITDRLTGKQSLIGMFSTIHSFRFPAVHPRLSVFCALTDGHGTTPLTIRIVDSAEQRRPLVEGHGTVDFQDPRAIANLSLQFHGLRFPEPGEYRVQLDCRGELLREARLILVKAQAPRPRGRSGDRTEPESDEGHAAQDDGNAAEHDDDATEDDDAPA